MESQGKYGNAQGIRMYRQNAQFCFCVTHCVALNKSLNIYYLLCAKKHYSWCSTDFNTNPQNNLSIMITTLKLVRLEEI